MKISLASIPKKGKFDDAHVYDYVCLTPLDTGYRSSFKDAMNKRIVQTLIKEVKCANPSFEAGDKVMCTCRFKCCYYYTVSPFS